MMSPLSASYAMPTRSDGLCDFGHQGLLHDKEFGLIYNRARYLDPVTKRFTGRDPLGYVDGMVEFRGHHT
ncbi:MAG: hypothetical protein GY842_02315 [bacterium]|nr:hypothetical protein [bacterium]